ADLRGAREIERAALMVRLGVRPADRQSRPRHAGHRRRGSIDTTPVMKLRTKLLIGYLQFVLALAVLGAWSARTLFAMSTVASRVISENYDSVVAAQEMKESLERQDSAALFDLLGQHDRARRQAAEHRVLFDNALARAASNITEPGEREVVEALRRD